MVTERLTHSDYVITEEKQSEIDPDKFISLVVGITCPRCKAPNKPTEHGVPAGCPNCGLTYTQWGNELECTT